MAHQRQYPERPCANGSTSISVCPVFGFARLRAAAATGMRDTRRWSGRGHFGSVMSETSKLKDIRQVTDEPPPFLGRWPRVYAAVLGILGIVIAALYAFMRSFTP
jgi:hypothetical protein